MDLMDQMISKLDFKDFRFRLAGSVRRTQRHPDPIKLVQSLTEFGTTTFHNFGLGYTSPNQNLEACSSLTSLNTLALSQASNVAVDLALYGEPRRLERPRRCPVS